MGNAFQDFAEVADRRLPHTHDTPSSNGSGSRKERNTASIWSLVSVHERCVRVSRKGGQGGEAGGGKDKLQKQFYTGMNRASWRNEGWFLRCGAAIRHNNAECPRALKPKLRYNFRTRRNPDACRSRVARCIRAGSVVVAARRLAWNLDLVPMSVGRRHGLR
jgi:hypothetical protein